MSDEEIADARREHDDLPFDGKHEPDGIDALGIILRVTKDLDALGDEAMPVLEFQGNHGDIDLALERFAKAIERVLGRYSGQMREAVK